MLTGTQSFAQLQMPRFRWPRTCQLAVLRISLPLTPVSHQQHLQLDTRASRCRHFTAIAAPPTRPMFHTEIMMSPPTFRPRRAAGVSPRRSHRGRYRGAFKIHRNIPRQGTSWSLAHVVGTAGRRHRFIAVSASAIGAIVFSLGAIHAVDCRQCHPQLPVAHSPRRHTAAVPPTPRRSSSSTFLRF
jgi:hypothetical protein